MLRSVCMPTITLVMNALLSCFAAPARSRPIRLPAFPMVCKSALLGLNSSTTLGVSTSTPNTTRFMLSRQAYYPLWADGVPSTSTSAVSSNFSYTAMVTYPYDIQRTTGETVLSKNFSSWVVGTRNSTSNYVGLTASVTSSVIYPITGTDRLIDGSPWLYAPPGAYIYMVQEFLAAHTADSTSVVDLELWQLPGQSVNTQTYITLQGKNTYWGAVGYVQVTAATWFRPSSISHDTGSIPNATSRLNIAVSTGAPTTGTAGGVNGFVLYTNKQPTVVPSTTQPSNTFLPVGLTNEFQYSVLPWTSTRIIGVSALFTNTTKALNKEGDVLCGRLNPADVDIFNHTRANLNSNHPSEKMFLGLEDGFYMYVPPGSEVGTYVDYTYYADNAGSGTSIASSVPTFNLGSTDFVCCANAADPDGGTNLSVSLDWTFEFKTTSTLWQLGVATTPIEMLHAAQVVLARTLPFSSNIDHVLLLRSLITAALTLYPAYTQAFTRGARATSQLLGTKPRSTPKPTTVARSALPPAGFSTRTVPKTNPLVRHPRVTSTPKMKAKRGTSRSRTRRARATRTKR